MKIDVDDEIVNDIVRQEMKNLIKYNLEDIRKGQLGAFSLTNNTYNDLRLSQIIAAAYVIHDYYSAPGEEFSDTPESS